MTDVFVVVGAFGEYENRVVFVCGVFPTIEAAIKAVNGAKERQRLYDEWSKRRDAAWPKLPPGYFKFPLEGNQAIEHEEYSAAARAAAGPQPPHEPAEEYEIFKQRVGLWDTNQNPIEWINDMEATG